MLYKIKIRTAYILEVLHKALLLIFELLYNLLKHINVKLFLIGSHLSIAEELNGAIQGLELITYNVQLHLCKVELIL